MVGDCVRYRSCKPVINGCDIEGAVSEAGQMSRGSQTIWILVEFFCTEQIFVLKGLEKEDTH